MRELAEQHYETQKEEANQKFIEEHNVSAIYYVIYDIVINNIAEKIQSQNFG